MDSKQIYEQTGQVIYKPAETGLRYSYSFAELLDRATIVTMKIANASDPKAFEEELSDILNDIQIHLNEKPMTAEQVKGLIVLTQVNTFIWNNESYVRDVDDKGIDKSFLLNKLMESHKANSLRGEAKKHIQTQRCSRIDPKLNYKKSDGFWNIDFNKPIGENEQWRYM